MSVNLKCRKYKNGIQITIPDNIVKQLDIVIGTEISFNVIEDSIIMNISSRTEEDRKTLEIMEIEDMYNALSCDYNKTYDHYDRKEMIEFYRTRFVNIKYRLALKILMLRKVGEMEIARIYSDVLREFIMKHVEFEAVFFNRP